MQLRKCAILIAALGLAAPVFAQSGASGSTSGSGTAGPSSINETTGSSNAAAGQKAQGSGSADLNTNRPSSPNRATGTERADQRKSDRAKDRAKSGTDTGTATGTTGGTAGAGGNIGASGVNETTGSSRAGVKAQGSGSGAAGGTTR